VFCADRGCLTSSTGRGGGALITVSKSFHGVKRIYDLEATKECMRDKISVGYNYCLLIGNQYFTSDYNDKLLKIVKNL
jgi:hypothetical protein